MPSALSNRAILLCWHTFLGQPSFDTDFSLEELAAPQLDSLAALGYKFLDLATVLAGRIEDPLNIVATIDDGHRTVPAAIEKVFLPRGIRPALFIYPAIIGAQPYAMDEATVRRMRDLGAPIGAHGYYHLYVTEELHRDHPAMFAKEIYKAKSKTEEIGPLRQRLCLSLRAYSPITLKEVSRAGYSFALAANKPGFVFGSPSIDPDYELPRYVVTRAKWKELYAFLERSALAVEAAK